jgi:diaminopimelate epimerase
VSIPFVKYEALANDYVVLEAADLGSWLTPEHARLICDRHRGVGSDGVLVRLLSAEEGRFAVRIVNPDGSEAEKSGNGLRIFARYLHDRELVGSAPFEVETLGGHVTCHVSADASEVSVDMGEVSFEAARIPVRDDAGEVLRRRMTVDGEELTYSAATVGNPHCVVERRSVSEADARRFGPPIEDDERFPRRTNVQLMQVLDRGSIRIEIWERGAGYTLASGSSSCAAAAVAHRLGLCDAEVSVHMPGGVLQIRLDADYHANMTGGVARIAEGRLSDELVHAET